eukprot:1137018-Pelagomonas_calceolata.AAC.2
MNLATTPTIYLPALSCWAGAAPVRLPAMTVAINGALQPWHSHSRLSCQHQAAGLELPLSGCLP